MLELDRPRDSDTHTLADFIELLCLITIDRQCSRDLVADQISDTAGRNYKPSDAELDDAFSHLQWRKAAFGPSYPFNLDAHVRVLSAEEPLSEEKELYVLLLLCANLPFFKRSFYKDLTDVFERLSLASLKRMWPARAVIKAFGKNNAEYQGEKWERLNRLGQDIGGKPTCTNTTFRGQDVGDGGIDLVAWLPLDEHEGWNIPSALGQCACSREEWPKKQAEISNGRLGFHLNPSHPWLEMIFIPQCFRDNLGRWAVEGDLGRTIVVDRLRLLAYLEPDTDYATIAPPPALAAFLAHRLDLV